MRVFKNRVLRNIFGLKRDAVMEVERNAKTGAL
jgi:hypothetical protein